MFRDFYTNPTSRLIGEGQRNIKYQNQEITTVDERTEKRNQRSSATR